MILFIFCRLSFHSLWTESKTKSKKRETKNTDDDDASSSVSTEKSLKSMRNCKVVLEQIDLDDDEKLLSSVPKTRSRKKSTLTEENLAAFSPSATRRTTRSGSILSEETTSTKAPTLPLRVTRRNSTAAATAPIAVVTPKRDLRSTRASSNSSDDVSVKSRNRRISSPVEPRTPKITKKKGTSRLKSDTSESTEVISNIKSEKKSPEMTEEVEQSQLEPIVEDSFATPTGTAYTERSVISIYDSDEEIDSNIATAEPLEQDQTIEIVSTVTKPIATTSIKTMKQEEMNEDQNETVQVMPTVTTAIAVTETELLSLVKNSDAVKNVSVNTKSRPSISKWPKAKFRDEEEEPMDLSETINEENSVNQSADIFGRIAEVMASAAATTGADSQLSFVMPVDANGSEIMQPSEIPNEVMSVVDEKLVSVCEALTPAKIASPLKKTSQLMSATLSSQQAASPKAKPRTLSKLLDIDQNEDDQNADEVSEAPQTAQKSPKISPSKLDRIAPVVEAIAMTPQETPEPAAASTSSIDVTASEKTAKGATPMAAASTKSKFEISKNPLGIEKSTPPSEESADSMDISSAENAQSIDAQLSENQPNSPAVTVKTITETIQTTLSVTPKPLAEVRTIQTPELAVAENFAQSPELVEEPRYVQTPKMIDDKTASQTPKQMRAAQTPKMERKNTDGEATPQQLSKQLQKRRDTPYPDKTLLSTSAAQASGIVANESAVKTDLDGKKTRRSHLFWICNFEHFSVTEHLKASRERLKQLSSSYTQSVKRNSLDAPFIDGFGVQNKSATAALGEAPPKKFFAARNRLEDSDSSDHDNDEVEENTPKNEFVEDEAVEAMGYQSGDSMDSEERRDIEDNEHVEDGISLGSQDTDNENEDDDENDSFIASEDEVFDTLLSDEDDFDRLVSKSKYKRVVMESSSDSDNEDETTNVKNKSLVSAILSGSTEPLVDVVETRTETTVTDANKSIQTIVTETTTIEKTESSKTTRRSVQVEPEHKPVDMESSSESDDDEGVSANVESKFVVDAILSGSMRTAVDLVDETASSNVVIAEKTRTETTVTDTNKSIQTIVAESETIETSQLGKTTRRSVQVENTNDSIGDFVVSESLQHSIADESVNKSVNKTGFEETDRLSPEVSSNKLLVGSKKRDVSMSFVEEDATIEKTDTLIQSVGSVAAKFVETENAKTPEMAIEDIKETEIGTHESDDNDEENVQYSLNKSHPKFEEIVASALGGAKSPLVHHDEEAMSSEDEQSPTPTVVETTADKTVTDKSLAEVKAVEHQPSSDCDDDNTFYSFNEAHPANATLLRLMRASPRSAETTKSQPEQIVSTALNTSRGKDAKASKSAEKSLTPRQGKENVSANQVTVAVKTAVNRSLQDNENTSPALAFKTFLKKSANKSFGDIDTSQTLQVNPLSMHFDVNTSSLRRSSTPNQKALLKTQAVAAQSIASKPNDISNVASIELAPIESANRPKSARNSVKSPEIIESTTSPEANNNEKKPHKESSTGELISK